MTDLSDLDRILKPKPAKKPSRKGKRRSRVVLDADGNQREILPRGRRGEGSITERRPGVWLLKFQGAKDPATKRRKTEYRTFAGDEHAARVHLRELINAVAEGKFINRSSVTVVEWIDHWLNEIDGSVAATTLDTYRERLMTHVVPALGKKPLQKLSSSDLITLYKQMLHNGLTRRQGGLSRATVANIHRCLRVCLKAATVGAEAPLRISPAAGLKLPKNQGVDADEGEDFDPTATRMHVISPQQAGQFLQFLKADPVEDEPRLYELVTLAFDSGARRGELLGLRWQDVNLDTCEIRIRRSVAGIGWGADGRVIVKPTKNELSRTVVLAKSTVELLRDRWMRQQRTASALGGTLATMKNALVFPRASETPTLPVASPASVSSAFARRVAQFGKIGRFRLHDCRHCCASWLLAEGVPVTTVARRLGHKSVKVTIETYLHDLPDGQARAAEKLNQIMDLTREK